MSPKLQRFVVINLGSSVSFCDSTQRLLSEIFAVFCGVKGHVQRDLGGGGKNRTALGF
jgi:hypothetical protein